MATPLSISDCLSFLEANSRYLGDAEWSRIAQLLQSSGFFETSERSFAGTPEGGPRTLFSGALVEAKTLNPTGDIELDMLREVKEQMIFIQALRQNVVGRLSTLATRDLKDLITTTNSVFSMLTRLQAQIVNQDQVLRLQNATLAAISALPVEAQQEFSRIFEEKFVEFFAETTQGQGNELG